MCFPHDCVTLQFCLNSVISFIDNSNLDRSRLCKRKPHINRRGSFYLADSFKEFVASL